MRMPVETEAQDDQYARQFAEWRSIARYPELVASISIVRRPASDRVEVVRVAPDRAVLDRSLWPVAVERVVSYLDQVSGAPAAPAQAEWAAHRELLQHRIRAPGLAVRSGWTRARAIDVARHRVAGRRARRARAAANASCPISRIATSRAPMVSTMRWPSSRCAASGRGMWFTRPMWVSAETEVPDADGRMDVFGRTDRAAESTVRVFHRTSANSGPMAAVGVSWFPLFRETPVEDDWQLVVRHRRGGPLGSFVAEMRQRGLAVSLRRSSCWCSACRWCSSPPCARSASRGCRWTSSPRSHTSCERR